MKTRLYKIFSGIVIAIYVSSMAIPGAVFATPQQIGQEQSPAAKHETKRGTNPETGKLSFIGGGDPIFVPGVSDVMGMPPQQRAMGMANVYGKEFGLKNPSQELKLFKLQKDANGKDVARYQQEYRGIPVIAGEMIVNMNTDGKLLSISGEVSADLTLDTKPAIQAQAARKTALVEIANLYRVDEKNLIASDPELWIFDESLLMASTRPVELVWRMEVTAKDATQPIREMVLVNAQTGKVSWHINQVDAQTTTWPVYFDIELDEARGWIYGSDSTGNKIDVISMSTLVLVKSFVLVNGSTPKCIALSPDGSELAIAEFGASSILFLNPDTGGTIATIIPNTTYTKAPWDLLYGRSGRLYSSGASDYYVHVIDTVTHTEVSRSPLNTSLFGTRLAISSDKNWLYASKGSGSPEKLFKYDISTDTIPDPISSPHTSGLSLDTFILDPVSNLIFTDTGQVWPASLKGFVGSTGASGQLTSIPFHNAVVVASNTNNIIFISTENFYTLSAYPIQGPMGPIVSQADGSRVFVSTSSGIVSVDLSNFPPGIPGTLPAGSLPYSDLILDEPRGVLYGSNILGHKIDVISIDTLQVVDQIRLNNGAQPHGMDLSPDGSELAVAVTGANSLAFIDTNTRTISAMVMPNLDGAIRPFDVKYGRVGRLYSSGTGGLDYLHVFDTTTHTEVGISPYPNTISSAPYLSISADKNFVYANEAPQVVRLFDVSTDSPVISKSTDNTFQGTNSLLLADNGKLFTSAGQVWLSSLIAKIGSFNASGHLVEIPGQSLVAAISSASPGQIKFVKTADFYTASTASIPSVSAVGASTVSSAGGKLFVNTNNGIKVLDVASTNPTSISITSGSPQFVQVSMQFQQPFKVKVQNVAGSPMPGVMVTFTAPSAAASGTFADTNLTVTTAITDANGIATSSMFTANNTAGAYIVKATVSNLAASADFQLTNLAAVNCTITIGSDPNTLFLAYKQFNCGKISHGVTVGDFNNDGRKDVALSGAGSLLVFLQDNAGNLLQPRVYGSISEYFAAGDVNHDGLDDIVSADTSSNTISVYLQRNDGTLAYRVTYPTSTNPDAVAVGDLNNDGLKDVAVSHWNSAVIGVFTQNPGGTFNPMVSYPSAQAGYDDIAIGDVNNDGRNDVVKMNGQLYANPNLQVYLQNANGALDTAIPYSLGCTCLGSGIGIGDVTGDGRSDVVMSYGGNKPNAKIAVFAQDSNGNLQSAVSYAAYDIPRPVEIADVNSDSLLEVVTLHSAWGRAGVFLHQQDGSLGMESLYTLPNINSSYNPADLSIGDVNNDGLPDLLIAGYTGLVVLHRNTTIPPTSTPIPSSTPSYTPGPTSTSGPGPSPTPRPSSTAGPSPTSVPSSSSGSRRTYTASGGYVTPGTFLCDQNQSICTNSTDPDADKAHQYAADTFMFYNVHHGRNSFDNQGGTIISTVHFGVGYQNAFWDGYQMVYGDNMAADDVVGHEITHGVTQYTSNLIYSYQSGAINESFSDVWGEFIDQTNGSGNDSPSVKWMLGEDTPLGVIRSMSNPTTYSHPDKMSSPYFYTGSGDNGGVHINSGVNNKAAYLMVDGSTFNGRTIIGIGLNKTAAVYYEAQVYHLTMGANYNDLYYALIQACENLIGGVDGITQNDCDQVRIAAEAVEMIPTLPATATPTATSTFIPTDIPTNTPTFTPTNTFTPTATPPYSYNPLYLSLTSSQTIGGLASADEDILKFDGTNWSLFFDGSDVGVGSPDLFAFSFLDADSILMSFTANVTVNGITATPQDVLRFDATSLGSTTVGTFSLYFDGSDVGFDTTSENIDSLSLLPDGRLLISTTGSPSVPGLTTGKDEDVLAFTQTSLGDVTSGTWSLYFDGSDVGLADTNNEDVDALDVIANGNIYLSTLGDFAVNGLSGFDEDVFVCTPTSIGDVTACNYSPTLYFDGSTWGLSANDVDAFNFLETGPIPTTAPSNTPTITPTRTNTPLATNTSTRTNTPLVTNTPTRTPSPTPTFTRTATNTPGSSPSATNTSTFTVTPTASNVPVITSTPTNTATATSTLSLIFIPIEDAYIASGSPTINAGSATTLQVDNSPIKHFLLKFNVSGLNGKQVVSAKLRLYNVDPSSKGGDFYAVSDTTWQEETITWNNAPAALTNLLASLGSVSANNWYEVDLTSLITGDGTYSLRIASTSSDGADYSSKEGTNPSQLVITIH
jgi:Zn-dependent metalloprotease